MAERVPKIENRSIDEIYLALTDAEGETHALAVELKNAVRQTTGLSCSIGVAPNKVLAKICSDLDKPDGLTLMSRDDIACLIWP